MNMQTFLSIMLVGCSACSIASQETPSKGLPKDFDAFNYVLGTQTIGASYQFTKESKLVETARAISEMGSNSIKFAMSRNKDGSERKYSSLKEMASEEPSCKTVFDMPFARYAIWTYAFSSGSWKDGFSKEEQEKEYSEIYEFVSYLLKNYDGSGKTFFLGHWEGDWALRGIGNSKDEDKVKPEAIQGMIDWLNIRQKAVDDARKDNPNSNVQVWHYTEVNRVDLSMKGMKTVANDVIPNTNVDYVSYSCYESQKNPDKLRKSLDYIESKLPSKQGIPGKRVFIGEYGFDIIRSTPEEQDVLSRQVIRTALDWGCPMILYWEMYNNEVDDSGRQRGFWLINDKNEKQPVYYTHQRYYQWAKSYVSEFKVKNGRQPSSDEFRREAVAWFDELSTKYAKEKKQK